MSIIIVLLVVLALSRSIATLAIDYAWWKEMGQVQTWLNLAVYGTAPVLTAGVAAGLVLWVALARGLKASGEGLGTLPRFTRLATVGAFLMGLFIASTTIENWDAVRFIAGRGGLTDDGDWRDPIFGHSLAFYMFDLPFYRAMLHFVMFTLVAAILVFLAASQANAIRMQLSAARRQAGEFAVDISSLSWGPGLQAFFVRMAGALLLLALAARVFTGRYDLLFSDHGFMTGVDYVDEHVRLPLRWLLIGAIGAAAALAAGGRWRGLLLIPLAQVAHVAIPQAVHAIYVRPNEINLEKPYIANHIEATRHAFGLSQKLKTAEYGAKSTGRIDQSKRQSLLDNVRLWDWQAFHDTVTQIQSLRPYYVFQDTDVDRYQINGQLRQVMLTPRELDLDQLPDAQRRWVNPRFIYTHGYGVVVAEANRITADGLPSLLVKDAPPVTAVDTLRPKRPEIYFGENVHEPVFVRTGQKEFSYPSGNESVFTRYEGQGGFPIDSFGMRLAAAVRDADPNVLLTGMFTYDSRMMIRRNVRARLQELAGFLHWDRDPYLVVTKEGRLVWTVDGYSTSASHPYSEHLMIDGERCNYIRNSVKATVDAYEGTVRLFVFDTGDPIVQAYSRLFPGLFEPAAQMPADLREHVRYPELLFRAQAEIYRVYHMRDPQAFYNKEDVWDLPRNAQTRSNQAREFSPTYLMTVLPGETKPEFVLMLPFTPRGRQNMVGIMMARCDGDKLGQLQVLQLSKQELIFGPGQMDARIDQDPEISKDLTLWSQKGSEVLRGQMMVLPVDGTFLYVEPIYIQSSEAKMPQLKKVVVAMGNELFYRNTYEDALAALGSQPGPAPAAGGATPGAAAPVPGAAASPAPPVGGDGGGAGAAGQRLEEIRSRLRRYRDLLTQGRYAEAGRELEQVEALAGNSATR